MKWAATIKQMCAERFPGSRAVLDKAKGAGATSVQEYFFEELDNPSGA